METASHSTRRYLVPVIIVLVILLMSCIHQEDNSTAAIPQEIILEEEVEEKLPLSIQADTAAVDTTLLLSRASLWSYDDLRVTVAYSDGSSEEITTGYIVDAKAVTEAVSAGAKQVTIALEDQPEIRTSFTVLLTSFLLADMDWYLMDPEAEEFFIGSEEELAGLKSLVDMDISFSGRTIHLTDDIDMGGVLWGQIGSQMRPFEGSFDGGGHTISNLAISSAEPFTGLFSNVRGTSSTPVVIRDLTIEGARVISRTSAGTIAAGVVVGNGTYVQLSGVTVEDGSLTVAFGSAGAIAGTLSNSAITECVNNGVSVTATGNNTSYIAGIAGQVSYTDIVDCSVTLAEGDEILAEGTSSTHAAGIAGFQRKGTISGCTLTLSEGARIAAAGTNPKSSFYAGGICAYTLTATISGNTVNTAGRDQITCTAASPRWFLGKDYTSGVIFTDNTYNIGGSLSVLCAGSSTAAADSQWDSFNPVTR